MVAFVSGIHGVGKTYLCEKYVASRDDVIHESSSALIRKAKNSVNWSTEKRVIDVNDNQIALTQEVKKITSLGKKLILDGHTVLLGAEGQYVHISPSVFSELGITAIILIESDTETILQRLRDRDATKNIADLEKFMSAERMQAKLVADSLSIPLEILVGPTTSEFTTVIDNAF